MGWGPGVLSAMDCVVFLRRKGGRSGIDDGGGGGVVVLVTSFVVELSAIDIERPLVRVKMSGFERFFATRLYERWCRVSQVFCQKKSQ